MKTLRNILVVALFLGVALTQRQVDAMPVVGQCAYHQEGCLESGFQSAWVNDWCSPSGAGWAWLWCQPYEGDTERMPCCNLTQGCASGGNISSYACCLSGC
jgi:hypothetical protein